MLLGVLFMTLILRLAAVALAAVMFGTVPASAQQSAPYRAQPAQRSSGPGTYSSDELLTSGTRFFGNVSRGLASVIERAVSQWGLPNGYILGEEAGGVFVALPRPPGAPE